MWRVDEDKRNGPDEDRDQPPRGSGEVRGISLQGLSLRDRMILINWILEREYGQRVWDGPRDPMDVLLATLLSQNTSDRNSHRAFSNLKALFPSWERLMEADPSEIADSIRIGGLADLKAKRIKAILGEIKRREGEISLDFLANWDVEDAMEYLTSLEGVGPKTAACVLCFAFGKPAFPVDTHILRISKRIGLIGSRDGPEKAQRILQEAIPPEIVYQLHMNMIAHGRRICKARKPACEICPLSYMCSYGKAHTPA
jgi:endonuclease-3